MPSSRGALPLAEAIHLRVNQVGYRPSDPKIAFALSGDDLRGRKFDVRGAGDRAVVLTGEVGRNRGSYGRFPHVYELELGALNKKGTYVLAIGEAKSLPFAVARADVSEPGCCSTSRNEVHRSHSSRCSATKASSTSSG